MSSQRSRSPVTVSGRRSSQRGLVRPAQMALVAMGGVLLIYAQAVAALGVGEPRYLSHLFEPLRVDVPVDTRGVDPAAVKVGVSISGVDPAAAAEIESRLHREWQRDGEGRHVLHISTDQPIHEPMMQMRVEVGDDRIQAIRELTLLLDPAPVDVPAVASLEADAVSPAVVAVIADEAPQAAAGAAPDAEASPAVQPIAITWVAPMSAVIQAAAPAALAAAPRAVAAEGGATQAAAPASPLRPQVAPVAARAPTAAAAAPILLAPKALLAAPALIRPVADPSAALLPVASSLRLSSSLSAQIASTRRPQALSAADRWQRLVVGRGDTLDGLAARARGGQTAIPLPMVAMLLRWLNPRAFDGVGREPLVGAELRFPKPESLAAQIAISGGVWTVDDVTAGTDEAARAVVPPPSFQVLNPHSADDLAAAMGIGTALLAGRPAAASASPLPPALSAGRSAGAGGLAASGTVVGGAVVAGLLSVLMMLNMVVTTPAPARSRTVPATVVARHAAAPASAEAAATAARALPAESLDLATLDLASLDALRQRAAPVARGHADS